MVDLLKHSSSIYKSHFLSLGILYDITNPIPFILIQWERIQEIEAAKW